MARLSVYLPPFSPDYSGVASAFFDLGALSVLHDASGCTGTYTGYDEPRWYGSQYPAYCSGLREIDAIMGNDQKLIDCIVAAEKDIKAELITVIGSPVPMVVGCDAAGIAAEVEALTGIPSFGFDTTGTAYYDKGIAMAAKALLERFSVPCRKQEGTVNILGLDAIDFPLQETREAIIRSIESTGLKVNASFPVLITLEKLRKIAEAEINVVVSASGIEMAERMKKKYGTPFVIGLPYGNAGLEHIMMDIEGIRAGRGQTVTPVEGKPRALIIGEAVSAMAIRDAIYDEYGIPGTAASLFSKYAMLEDMGCRTLSEESLVRSEMNQDWDFIISDPILRKLLEGSSNVRFIDNPTYSISSKLYLDRAMNLVGNGIDKAFGNEIRKWKQEAMI